MNHLQRAILEIGNEEIPRGSNGGIHVMKYLNSVGINFEAPWCMAFVYWCVENSDTVNILNKTGGVLKQWNNVLPLHKNSTPQIGDVFIMDFGHGLGHTGFVEGIENDFIQTIEGNATATSGSREGYKVCRKNRKISAIKGFIRLNNNQIV